MEAYIKGPKCKEIFSAQSFCEMCYLLEEEDDFDNMFETEGTNTLEIETKGGITASISDDDCGVITVSFPGVDRTFNMNDFHEAKLFLEYGVNLEESDPEALKALLDAYTNKNRQLKKLNSCLKSKQNSKDYMGRNGHYGVVDYKFYWAEITHTDTDNMVVHIKLKEDKDDIAGKVEIVPIEKFLAWQENIQQFII